MDRRSPGKGGLLPTTSHYIFYIRVRVSVRARILGGTGGARVDRRSQGRAWATRGKAGSP